VVDALLPVTAWSANSDVPIAPAAISAATTTSAAIVLLFTELSNN